MKLATLDDGTLDGRPHLPLGAWWNGERFGAADGGAMAFGFHDLVAHAARTRELRAGTVIGSGTVSNAAYRETGSSCTAERRAIERVDHGSARTRLIAAAPRRDRPGFAPIVMRLPGNAGDHKHAWLWPASVDSETWRIQ